MTMNARRFLVLATSLALAAACTTVGPRFTAPTTSAPAHWSDWHSGSPSLAMPTAPALAGGWQRFDDPVLAQLLERALESNLDLRTAATRFAEARVQERIAGARALPEVGGRAGVNRERQSENGVGTRIVGAIPGVDREHIIQVLSQPFTLYQAGFDASWELDLWGRVARTIESARADTQASAADLRAMRLEIAAEVARAYFHLRSVQEELALLREQRERTAGTVDILGKQYRLGMVDETALLREQVLLDELASQRPQLLAAESAALSQLTKLCGEHPGALNDLLARTPKPMADERLPDLALGLPGDFVRRRPDVAAAEARLHAATAQIGVATADLYPQITLGATAGLESLTAGHLLDWGSRQWSVGPALSLPIFDHGRRKSVVELRELQQQEAAIEFHRVVLRAWHEADDAITAYVAETKRARELESRARRAEDAAMLAKARFENGLANDLPRLTAERDAINAQRDLVESRYNVRAALVGVFKALADDGFPDASKVSKP